MNYHQHINKGLHFGDFFPSLLTFIPPQDDSPQHPDYQSYFFSLLENSSILSLSPGHPTPLSPVHLGSPRTPVGSLSLGSHALRLETPSLIPILLSKHAQNLGPCLCRRFESREEFLPVCVTSLLQLLKQNPPLLTDP